MNENVSKYLLEPLTVASVGYGASKIISGKNLDFVMASGKRIDLALFVAGGFFLGKIVDNAIGQFVFPEFLKGKEQSLNTPAIEALSITTLFGVDVGVHMLANPAALASMPLTELLIEASVAQIGGSYLYSKWIEPTLSSMMA